MDEQTRIEKAELKQLESINSNIKDLKSRMVGPKRALFNGVMQGMGAVAGSIAAVALIGWILSLLGLIPGLETLGDYLRQLTSEGRN